MWTEKNERTPAELGQYYAEKMKEMQQNIDAFGSQKDTFKTSERYILPGQGQVQAQRPYVRPLGTISKEIIKTNAIFSCPIDTLKNMWRVKFDNWADENDVNAAGEEFIFIFKRLANNACFESMYVFNEGDKNMMYRLKEDA